MYVSMVNAKNHIYLYTYIYTHTHIHVKIKEVYGQRNEVRNFSVL
jgi:hypothetical protein